MRNWRTPLTRVRSACPGDCVVISEIDDLTIRRLVTGDDVTQWRAAFIGAYQTIFTGFPYFERWYPSEAEGVYRRMTALEDNITLLATRGEDQIVGFGVAIPILGNRAVSTHLSGLVPLKHTYYLAELGVLDTYRGRGIGRTLVRERLRLIDAQRYSHVVLRVSTNHNPSSEMYKAMGFEEMGVYMDVSAMRIDGKVTTDRRMFLSKLLSQVPID
jgi:ribosomal protein S18 acetylase RimI-like enzyme